MADNNNAHVSINLNDGTMEISGSELFVRDNLEKVFAFLANQSNLFTSKACVSKNNDGYKSNDLSIEEVQKENIIPENVEDENIKAGIYHIDNDGTISILRKIPGNTKAEKIRMIALIVSYIKGIRFQGKEIVPICEKHGCYDSKNFARIIDQEKQLFIKKGTGKNWTIEITQPGREAAEKLFEEMRNG